MWAVVIREHGGPEVLRLEEVPVPEVPPGHVRVRIRAAAMNHLDLWVRRGPAGRWPLPLIPGSDGAGVVEAVGEGVTGVQVGDSAPRVCGATTTSAPSTGSWGPDGTGPTRSSWWSPR
jgi:NADPH:quinone reductase-like Zn-dependent oxidoreductase